MRKIDKSASSPQRKSKEFFKRVAVASDVDSNCLFGHGYLCGMRAISRTWGGSGSLKSRNGDFFGNF